MISYYNKNQKIKKIFDGAVLELITLLISSLDLRLALGINLYLLVIFEDSIRDKSVEKGII